MCHSFDTSKTSPCVTLCHSDSSCFAYPIIELIQILAAVLKQGSPSCGSRWVYDGAFQGQRIAGQGITAWLLRASGLQVASEDELAQVLGEQ